MVNTVRKQSVAVTTPPVNVAADAAAILHEVKSAALRVLGLPIRGVEKLGAAVLKWLQGPPEGETAWMHNTDFGTLPPRLLAEVRRFARDAVASGGAPTPGLDKITGRLAPTPPSSPQAGGLRGVFARAAVVPQKPSK